MLVTGRVCMVSIQKAVNVMTMEKLAFWCFRYFLILQVFKPLSTTPYDDRIGLSKRNSRKYLSQHAILAIYGFGVVFQY